MPDDQTWESLTRSPEKRRVFEKDIYLRECWADCVDVLGGSGETVTTLQPLAILMFKPDATVGRRMVTSLEYVRTHGFVPIATARVRLNRHSMRELWRHDWHVYTTDRLELSNLLYTAGEMLMLVLRDTRFTNVIPGSVRFADLKGPSRPEMRTSEHLRVVLSPPNKLLNFVHVCDEPADIVREFGIFFGRSARRDLLRHIALQSGSSAWEEAQREVASIEAKYPPHDLDFDRSLIRLNSAQRAGGIAMIREAVSRKDILRWDTLCSIIDPADPGVDVWDFISVACDVLPLEREAEGDLPAAFGSAGWARQR